MLVNVGRSLLWGTKRRLPFLRFFCLPLCLQRALLWPWVSSPRRRPWGSACCLPLSHPKRGFRTLLQPRVANRQPGPVPGRREPQPVSFAPCSICCDGAALAAALMWQDVLVPSPRDGGVQGCAFPAWMSGKAAPLRESGLWSGVWCVGLPLPHDLSEPMLSYRKA